MNKHIVNSLKEYNFTYDKNYGYGFINGYEVNVFYNATAVGPVITFSTFLSQSKKNDFIFKEKNHHHHTQGSVKGRSTGCSLGHRTQ